MNGQGSDARFIAREKILTTIPNLHDGCASFSHTPRTITPTKRSYLHDWSHLPRKIQIQIQIQNICDTANIRIPGSMQDIHKWLLSVIRSNSAPPCATGKRRSLPDLGVYDAKTATVISISLQPRNRCVS
jgi:hypothetical protein